eukprot:jgi/Botrbrau1/14441/Bobra.0014s0087.2
MIKRRWAPAPLFVGLFFGFASAQEKATKIGPYNITSPPKFTRPQVGSGPAPYNGTEEVPLLPLGLIFGNPTRGGAKISPDGQHLAFLAPSNRGVLNVWVMNVNGTEKRQVTNDTRRPIRAYAWTESSQYIAYIQDNEGDENYQLYAQALDGTPARSLTPVNGTRVEQSLYSHAHPDEVLVGWNLRNRTVFDMYRINITSGAARKVETNPGNVVMWYANADLEILGAMASRVDGGQVFRVRSNVSAPWRDHITWPFEESGAVLGFTLNSTSVYVASSIDSNTMRVLKVSMAPGARLETVVAQSDLADVGDVLIDPIYRNLLAVSFDYLEPVWDVLDPKLRKQVEHVKDLVDGPFALDSWTADRSLWTVRVLDDNGPRRYYLYNTTDRNLSMLWVDRPELLGFPLSVMEGVVIYARDGVPLPSYLSLPVLPEGTPAKNLSMVLLVHGGPWARDRWGYNPTVQWLSNRGYAVLQVNFRSSTGYGKEHLHLGDKQWGQAMQDDLTDAVLWAVQTGIADPNRIAIMGGSYGGYATLAGLTFTPELYACGVDIVGPSNLETLFASLPDYWGTEREQLLKRVGDIPDDTELNERISPLFHVDKIRVPLLIGQGANDPRVKRHESDAIFRALSEKGLYVEYYVYPDEGHGFVRPPNNMDFYLRVDNFLAKCLGGRAEPLTPIPGATTQVIAGPLGGLGLAAGPMPGPGGLAVPAAPGPSGGAMVSAVVPQGIAAVPLSGSPKMAPQYASRNVSTLQPKSVG